MGKIFDAVGAFAHQTGDKPALVENQGRLLSYGQLYRAASRLAASLGTYIDETRSDVPISRIALSFNSQFDQILVVLALNALSYELVPVNPKLTVAQMDKMLAASAVDLIFHDLPSEDQVASSVDLPRLSVKHLVEDALLWEYDDYPEVSSKPYGVTKPFLITLSSGSTGSPKPVIFGENTKIKRSAQACNLYGINASDIVLNASPFFHSLGQRLTFVPLLAGATLVLLERFSADRWINCVETHGVTFTIPVSTHLHAVAEYLISDKPPISLRAIVSSSANLEPAVKKKLFSQEKFLFFEMYGATEVATVTSVDKELMQHNSASLGKVCAGVNVVIRNDSGEECAVGEVGEICVKSPLAFLGYFGRDELLRDSIVNGYFRTSDLGFMDSEQHLYLVGRKSEVIITGGMNIYPKDIEDEILKIDWVQEVEVLGASDGILGEKVVAVICVEDGADSSELEIRKALRGKLASFQQPLQYFFFDEMPQLANGKRDKQKIKSIVSELISNAPDDKSKL